MTGEDFARWLAGKLEGRDLVNASWTTVAHELVDGAMRPAVVVGFPSGDAFVLAIAEVAS